MNKSNKSHNFLDRIIVNTVGPIPTAELQNQINRKTKQILDKQEVIFEYKGEELNKENLKLKIGDFIEKEDFDELENISKIIYDLEYPNYFAGFFNQTFEKILKEKIKNFLILPKDENSSKHYLGNNEINYNFIKIKNLLKLGEKLDVDIESIINYSIYSFIDKNILNYSISYFINKNSYNNNDFELLLNSFNGFDIDITEGFNKGLKEFNYNTYSIFFDLLEKIKENENLKIDLTYFETFIFKYLNGSEGEDIIKHKIGNFIKKVKNSGINLDKLKNTFLKAIYCSLEENIEDSLLLIKELENLDLKLDLNLGTITNINKIAKGIEKANPTFNFNNSIILEICNDYKIDKNILFNKALKLFLKEGNFEDANSLLDFLKEKI